MCPNHFGAYGTAGPHYTGEGPHYTGEESVGSALLLHEQSWADLRPGNRGINSGEADTDLEGVTSHSLSSLNLETPHARWSTGGTDHMNSSLGLETQHEQRSTDRAVTLTKGTRITDRSRCSFRANLSSVLLKITRFEV